MFSTITLICMNFSHETNFQMICLKHHQTNFHMICLKNLARNFIIINICHKHFDNEAEITQYKINSPRDLLSIFY